MEDLKDQVAQHEEAVHQNGTGGIEDFFQPESRLAKYIPGGYSPSRCLTLQGRAMMYAILSLAGISILFFGYDASVMSQVNTNENYLRVVGLAKGTDRDAAAVGGLVSIWFGGFAIGAILVGVYADKIGRLKTIQIGCVWAIVGAALMASAQNITWMMFARIIGGIGCGHLNTVVPIWTSELADAHLRGAFVAVEFTLALSGSTIVYWMEYACTKTQSLAFAWRFPIGLQALPLIFILILVPFYPESPRHLAKQGKVEEARTILTRCRLNPDPIRIDAEMEAIQEAIRLEAMSTAHSYYTMLFKADRLHTRRRILLGGGVQVMQKFTGIDFIATYAPQMFALSGFSANKSALLAGGNFISYTASLALSIWLSDRFGRRTNMLAGCFLMGLVLIAGAVCSREVSVYTASDPAKAKSIGIGVVAVLYIYTVIYGGTWLTTCWVYPTEVFPLATRAKGTALSTVAFSLAGGIINEIVPYLIAAINYYVFVLFALLNFVMLIPIYLFYIETANRGLEDMDLLFSSSSVFAWRAEREYAELMARRGDRRSSHDVVGGEGGGGLEGEKEEEV